MTRKKSILAGLMALILLGACAPDVRQWRVMEIPFHSTVDYTATGADNVWMDVTFTHARTGEQLTVPAFWDGDSTFRVRFAPTTTGRWNFASACPQDRSLNDLRGNVRCGKYKGSQSVYRHGFVRAQAGTKYMQYADGTPFFYLGDTHWGMYREEIDEPGPSAAPGDTQPHFQHIIDRRVEQGFTVYQSEPIDARFHLRDGRVDASDIEGFRRADRYYQYIADAGLVHANAEFFFAADMNPFISARQLENLSRYWVARYGAYPVLWTLAQEVDNDFYYERQGSYYDYAHNPWVRVAEYIHRYDAYKHPLSAHQENAWYTTVTGRGVGQGMSGNGESAFAREETALRTGHNWWAVQWSPSLTSTPGADVPADYRASEYPAVNYEGRYCGLWTQNFGSRAQGWISFLTGFCGYGYGAIEMWLYKSTYDLESTSFDGVDSISPADKKTPWSTALEFESAHQMTYLRRFFTAFDWWHLEPILYGDQRFSPADGAAWACATTGDRVVLYFYGKETATGTLTGLTAGKKVRLTWFNPRSGEQNQPSESKIEADGTLALPSKPDASDWVLTVKM